MAVHAQDAVHLNMRTRVSPSIRCSYVYGAISLVFLMLGFTSMGPVCSTQIATSEPQNKTTNTLSCGGIAR